MDRAGKPQLGRWASSPQSGCRGGATFTMVVFVLLLISTGFMYYFFQKSRALERELASWRAGEKSTVAAPEPGAQKPKDVAGYASAIRNKIMGISETPAPAGAKADPAAPGDKPAENPGTVTAAPSSSGGDAPVVPTSTPKVVVAVKTPAPVTAAGPEGQGADAQPGEAPAAPGTALPDSTPSSTSESLPAPDPFADDETAPAEKTPEAEAPKKPSRTPAPRGDRELESAQPSRTRRSTPERTPAPRTTPRKTPASNEKVRSMYDLESN